MPPKNTKRRRQQDIEEYTLSDDELDNRRTKTQIHSLTEFSSSASRVSVKTSYISVNDSDHSFSSTHEDQQENVPPSPGSYNGNDNTSINDSDDDDDVVFGGQSGEGSVVDDSRWGSDSPAMDIEMVRVRWYHLPWP